MKQFKFIHKETGSMVSLLARDYPHALDVLGTIVKDIFQFTEAKTNIALAPPTLAEIEEG